MECILERFVRLTAPVGKIDFVLKLMVAMLIGGALNHLRHVLTYGYPGNKTFWTSFAEAGFTTLPMCSFALLLIGHLAFLQKRLYLQATCDPLTTLRNRRWFMDNTPEMMRPSEFLMIIDIDRFKSINDRFGHDAGDRCLSEGADHLKRKIGSTHKLARIGGEEFAVFLPHADIRDVAGIAQNICSGFDFDTGCGMVQRVTFSVGIASFDEVESRKSALKRADVAVYKAKSEGRRCFIIDTGHRRHETASLVPLLA